MHQRDLLHDLVLVEVPNKNILERADETKVFFIDLAPAGIKHGCAVRISFSLKSIRIVFKLTP